MSIQRIKTFSWKKQENEQLENLHTEESHSTIEELHVLEDHQHNSKRTQNYWLGGSSIFTIFVITTIMYIAQNLCVEDAKPSTRGIKTINHKKTRR